VIRPSCCSSGNAGRRQCLLDLRAGPAGSPSSPDAGKLVAAARMTLTAIAGRVIFITSAASSRTGPSPAPVRAIWWCRHDAGDPPGPAGPGRSACSAAGPGQRHGGETPAARARASRTPLRRPSPPPPAGGPGKAGELRLLEWEVAAPQCGGSPATAKLPCTPSWAAGRASPPENAYPRQIVRAGWTGSSARDGLAPLTPASTR